jgi:sterol desaturase/sphingolipid hydroxylase (fatty acid hydroxylase superfamily)
MESIINYFEHIPASHRSAILVGGIAFFMLLETGIPLFKKPYNRVKHTWINIFFTLTTVIVNFILAFILLRGSDWAVANNFGILQWMPAMPLWAEMIVGLLLLDLIGAYFIHWTEHKVKWMWRFHLIHHTDTNVDTTTANRHHPGESVFRFVFTTMGAMLAGAPWWIIMMYQSMSAALSQFNHANIGFPKNLDKALSWILVTPGMHRIHHHYTQPYTDSNYGNIFSVWDRLFGTYRYIDNEKLIYGIDTHMKPEEHSDIINLLKIPFQKYRPPVGPQGE